MGNYLACVTDEQLEAELARRKSVPQQLEVINDSNLRAVLRNHIQYAGEKDAVDYVKTIYNLTLKTYYGDEVIDYLKRMEVK